MSSASSVFGIVEILQQILSELPSLDIIRCRRINATWKKIIDDSPLLQYKTWLRNKHPGLDRVEAEDRTCEGTRRDAETNPSEQEFTHYASRRLNPIVMASFARQAKENPDLESGWETLGEMEEVSSNASHSMKPVFLRDLMQWYEKHKATEYIWGSMPFYRPGSCTAKWEIPDSEESAITINFEAVHSDEPDAPVYDSNRAIKVNKKAGEPLVLTISDLMPHMDSAWRSWLYDEHLIHERSHDGEACNLDSGIPSEYYLDLDFEEDEDNGKQVGTRMTQEEHIDTKVLECSY